MSFRTELRCYGGSHEWPRSVYVRGPWNRTWDYCERLERELVSHFEPLPCVRLALPVRAFGAEAKPQKAMIYGDVVFQ